MSRNVRIFLWGLAFFFASGVGEGWAYKHMTKARWPWAKMPIPWYMSLNKTSTWGGRTKAQLEALARKSLSVWENVDCASIMFRYMGTTTTGSLKGDGLNTIEWTPELPKGATDTAIGLGGPLYNKTSIFEGNVWIKAMNRSDDFISIVITHEVGHAIGLGHTDVKYSIMYPSSNSKTHLTSDDRQGLCAAYPASLNSCAEDSHCPKGLVCKGQKCVKCSSDSDCGGDRYCDNELCVSKCSKDEDCQPKGRLCVEQRCTNCKDDNDCGEGRFCQDALCYDKCKTDDDCANTEDCRENGRCVKKGGCIKNSDCKPGEFCESTQCVSKGTSGKLCKGAADCDDAQDCVPHDCQVDLDCKEGYTCKMDQGTGTCVDKNGVSASVCGLLCKGKGAIPSCPVGFVCKEFTPDKSYCYPERRKPAPPPKTEVSPKDNGGGGCGCSATAVHAHSPMDMGLGLLWMLGWLSWVRRRRRR